MHIYIYIYVCKNAMFIRFLNVATATRNSLTEVYNGRFAQICVDLRSLAFQC